MTLCAPRGIDRGRYQLDTVSAARRHTLDWLQTTQDGAAGDDHRRSAAQTEMSKPPRDGAKHWTGQAALHYLGSAQNWMNRSTELDKPPNDGAENREGSGRPEKEWLAELDMIVLE